MPAPLNTCTTIEQRGVVRFLWANIWQQRISTKKCCPCTVNIACHVKQSSKTTSFGGTLSWRWHSGKSSVRVVPTATTRILCRRFPGTYETAEQVFKFVWRLRWKINVVCMSLSPFVSFQSRFVTYLLTFPHTLYKNLLGCIMIMHKIEHILCKYYTENWRFWRGLFIRRSVLHSGEYGVWGTVCSIL